MVLCPSSGALKCDFRPRGPRRVQMKVNVRFFAIARDLAGKGEALFDFPIGASAADALSVVVERFPELSKLRSRLALAVNQTYVRPDHRLQDGDELALIPPVSGG